MTMVPSSSKAKHGISKRLVFPLVDAFIKILGIAGHP